MEYRNKGEEERRHRLIILTDMENECDDSQTMVRLLKYATEVDIEGLITVTYCWLQVELFPESIEDRVKAYGLQIWDKTVIWKENDNPACLSEQPISQWKWAENNILRRHGLLGVMYSQRVHCETGNYTFMDGGGPTCLIGLVNKGLYEPEEISWVGWGGPFSREKELISAGQKYVPPLEEKFMPISMYPEAGNYLGNLAVTDDLKGIARFSVLQDDESKQIHIILKVTDDNVEAPLSSYKRIIINII